MKKIYLLLFICSISIASFAQVSVSQGFENSGALPTGWTTSVVSGTYNWIVATAVFALLHVPPVVASVKVIAEPKQTGPEFPLIAEFIQGYVV